MMNYKELEKKHPRVIKDIYTLEREESKGMETLGSRKAVQERMVTWWNEKGMQANILNQRSSFVLMQELKKKLKRVI
jgi:hypothetical protein